MVKTALRQAAAQLRREMRRAPRRRMLAAFGLALVTLTAGPMAFDAYGARIEAELAATAELAPRQLPRAWQWNPPTHDFREMVRNRG